MSHAMTDDQIVEAYREWWAQSWGTPPNHQAVAIAAAWGRHLLTVAERIAEEPDAD
jgi:hypothetical protein